MGKLFIASILAAGLLLSMFGAQNASASTLPPDFSEELVAGNLTSPTAMEFSPDGRLFVSEDVGNLRIIDVETGQLLSTPFLTVSTTTLGERGLFGIAFDPSFDTNGYVYVYYTAPDGTQNRVSRFTSSSSTPDVAVPGSEVVVLGDIPAAQNHNGGAIHFGIDNMLYIAVGNNENNATSQDLGSLNGKMLRINPSACDETSCGNIVPADNPFISTPGARGEVWAYGLRNPFTFGVDPVDGRIYINDVGEAAWEEVNLGIAGANYGWPICEGFCNPSDPTYTDPIYAYMNPGGAAITGGTFYRGSQFPTEYQGDYFFGDYLESFIRRLTPSTQAVDFALDVSGPLDVKVGPEGSLYYLSIFQGAVSRISYSPPPPTPTVFVNSISLSGKKKGPMWDVSGKVNIVDENNSKIQNATVIIEWTLNGQVIATETSTTNKKGLASFSTGRVASSGDVVTLTVTDVIAQDYAYDPDANIETTKNITL